MESNKKKISFNKKLILYLVMVMICIIIIMAISIQLSLEKKSMYYFSNLSELQKEMFLQDMTNLIIVISLIMIIVSILISIFLSQKISKPIIVVSKITDFIKRGRYDQILEYESSILEIDNLINSINDLSKKLSKMENMRKKLTSDISHELRTPLTSIQTHLEAMIDGIWEPSPERLNSINEEVIRLSHLVNQLKNLTTYDSDKNKLNLSQVNLKQLIKNIIYNNQSFAFEKNIKIEYELEDIVAKIDKEKITQVIVNLISNAIRYTGCNSKVNGIIFIKLYKENNFIKIIVKDNGIGIPEESLDYVFERFYRVDKSRCRNTGGTGIGLAICKSIIDLHKGQIEVKSKIDEGSEFIITLPV